MGSNLSCSIILASTNKGFYWTGETISGEVILRVDKSIIIRSIDLYVIGQLACVIPADNKSPETIMKSNFYEESCSLIILPTDEIFHDKEGYHLEPNTYHWPFSVRLAKYLPPTLMNLKPYLPYINYFVEIKLDYSRYCPNIRSQTSILVTPRVFRPRNVHSIQAEEKNFRDLYIHAKFLKNYLLIGEHFIDLELCIKNPSNTTIKKILVKLMQRRQFIKKKDNVVIFQHSLPDIECFQNNHLYHTIQVPIIPTNTFIAPTSYYTNPNDPSRFWAIEYVLEVIIKTKLFFTDVTLELPLLVVNTEQLSKTIIS